MKVVLNKEGQPIVMNRNGEVAILDEAGREREKYRIIYGAKLRVADGKKVSRRTDTGGVGPVHYAHPFGGLRARSSSATSPKA